MNSSNNSSVGVKLSIHDKYAENCGIQNHNNDTFSSSAL